MKKVFLGVVGVVLVLAIIAGIVVNTESGQDRLFETAMNANFSQQFETPEGLRVVVCGSASPLGNIIERAQACIAVVTKDHLFLFDVGARSPVRIAQARLPLSRLNGIFLTHYHSDHISGIPDVNLASWVQGRRESMKVYGPLGIDRVIRGYNEAFGQDFGYRTAHHGEEMLPPAAGPMTAVEIPMEGVAYEDEDLKITVFPVEHPPIVPAVGYRIDYKGRSVVISGDSNASDTLFEYAKDADLLLHDALSMTLLAPMIDTTRALNVPVIPTIMEDVTDYHAHADTLYDAAQAAGISLLAYYHLVPVPPIEMAEEMFLRGLPDDILLVNDLHTFDMLPGTKDIQITEP